MVMKPDKLFVSIFGLSRAQTTLDLKVVEQLTNSNVPVQIFNFSVNIWTKDCARFQQIARFPNQSINYAQT